MSKANEIFDSYNRILERCHEEFFEGVDGRLYDVNPRKYVEVLNQKTQECILDWKDKPLDDQSGLTPVALLKSINDFDEITLLFKYGAKVCNNGLPEIFVKKLEEFGTDAEDMLVSLSGEKGLMEAEDEMSIPLTAIQLLGRWKSEKTVNALFNVFYSCDKDNELFLETIRDSLVNIGSLSVEPIIKKLEEIDSIQNHEEYLLIALTSIGENVKSDRIYRCLKDTFSRMDNKVTGIICLGNYGDGRAIPALKGYLKKNADNIDNITYYEAKTAIEKLGGAIEDIDVKPV